MALVNSLIALGSNQQFNDLNPEAVLKNALKDISYHCGIILRVSPILVTKYIGSGEQDDYYNQVIELSTTLTSKQLLRDLLAIEHAWGRIRFAEPEPTYLPRTLDLDILTYGEELETSDLLTLPHPALKERPFIKELIEKLEEY